MALYDESLLAQFDCASSYLRSFGLRGFAARAQTSLRRIAAQAWMEIPFQIDTLVVSQESFRVVLTQVIFGPNRATVFVKGCFPVN